ncbi:MAG TPA: nucleotidyl transferase AbiEii/AbiGii toxin family protein [Gemmatimonadaceae bacterium]
MIGPRQKPPAGPPPSAGVLAKYARAYAKELGVSEGRVRAWISYMILAGLLEQSREGSDGYRFTVKGGVALELRLRDRARATKDIDLVLHHDEVDLARALERAVETGVRDGYLGFHFRRKGDSLVLENRTISVEFAVTYQGGTWTSIIVDVARAEPGEGEIELLPAVPLREATGITGPTELACLPLRMHIAQKLHGMTLPPRSGKRNERFKDLVDVLLMEALVTDYAGLRAACELVFRTRGTHDWPPVLELPSHWAAPFAALARELDLPVHDAQDAMERMRAFVDHIGSA